jgi:DNA end-binding protein Ku
MLNTMRYSDQLRAPTDIDLPADGLKAAGVTPKEIELAKRLVSDMAEPWKPGEFKDSYHQDLMRRIKEKIKKGETKEITEPDATGDDKPRSAQIIDLAALLQQSLRTGGRMASKSASPRSATAKSATKGVVRALPRPRAAATKAKRKSA